MPLYVVATPIGNMEDITLRAIKVLQAADIIAAEDTRKTARMLDRHGITHKMLRSFHEHNEKKVAPLIIEELLSGKDVALVSDAGTPTISDPGFPLVGAAIENGIEVIPIPGPSAVASALAVSGLPVHRFTFCGFLPRTSGKRARILENLAEFEGTIIFYESPFRLVKLLSEAQAVLGDRKAVVAREMTKLHEEFARGTLSELVEKFKQRNSIKGEITLLIEGHKKVGKNSKS